MQDFTSSFEQAIPVPAPISDASDMQSTASKRFYTRFGKRAFDAALTLLAAPVVVPSVLLLAGVIALDGSSPFFTQQRVGRGGRNYKMWKLRSMVPNAEPILEKHLDSNPKARAEWDSHQKLAQDPRITRIGKLIRKTSLDELPQLWNVLLGDMSLVGPRPMMPSQKALYPGTEYYNLRPGITGSWQVSDRNKSTFAERAGFDASYLQNQSLKTDLTLLRKTISVVLKATGC